MKTALSQERAEVLRRQSTEAEKKLWLHLRNRQIDGVKFQRQAPIGPYIADFLVVAAPLVIELDGGQHSDQTDHDEKRTAWLEDQGYRVLRFWNNDVLANTDGVIEVIQRFLQRACPALTLIWGMWSQEVSSLSEDSFGTGRGRWGFELLLVAWPRHHLICGPAVGRRVP